MKRHLGLILAGLALTGGMGEARAEMPPRPLAALRAALGQEDDDRPLRSVAPTSARANENPYAPLAPEPCCDGCDSGGFYAGASFLYLQAHWKTNPAALFVRNIDGTTFIRQEDFSYDYEGAPLIWLGWRNADGFGFRARYFYYDADASLTALNDGETAIDSAGPLGLQNLSTTLDDQLSYSSDLRLYTFDLEATQTADVCGWSFTFFGGVRYAHISQSYVHAEVPVPNDGGDVFVDAISSGHNFKGVGPTFGVEVRRELGSNFALFSTFRESILFGTGRQRSFQLVNNELSADAATSRDDILPITELEIGGEVFFNRGGRRFSVHAALVGQLWHEAGNASNNDLIPVLVDPEVSDNKSNLGLFGFRVGVAIHW